MRFSKQEKTAIAAMLVNSVLTSLKFVLAWLTLSIALKADAIHSFSDIFSSFAVFWASRKDRKDGEEAANEEQPVRSRRWFIPGAWESRIAIGIGIFLIVMSINVFSQTRSPVEFEIQRPLFAASILLFLALLSFLLSKLEINVGNKTDSSALVADGYHARVDMVVTLFVALVLLGVRYGYQFDKVGAIAIAIFILINGIQALFRGFSCYWSRRSSVCDSEKDIFVLENIIIDWTRKGLHRVNEKVQQVPVPRVVQFLFRSRRIFIVSLVVICCFVYFRSGFFVLRPSEEAIVEVFGVVRNEGEPLQPGLHYVWPKPIGNARIVDSGKIRRLEMNYKVRRDQPDFILWTNVHYTAENALLTGENSFLDLAMVVRYRISDLSDYFYQNDAPEALLRFLSLSAIRKEVGSRRFFDIITGDRDELEDLLKEKLQRDSMHFRLGLDVLGVSLMDMHPPVDIAIYFEDVVSAQEDYETFIQEAKGYRMDLIPRARATALKTISEATGSKAINSKTSMGKSEAFISRLAEYNKSKSVTEKRLLLETMEEVLASVPKYIIPGSEADSVPGMWILENSTTGNGQSVSVDSPEQEKTLNRDRITSEEDLVETLGKIRMGLE